jgi:hypothetical protein
MWWNSNLPGCAERLIPSGLLAPTAARQLLRDDRNDEGDDDP